MKKKILIIILIGVVTTFLIYKFNKSEKIYFLSLGDGLATGMTAYNIEGYSYNDYIRDHLEKEQKLEQFIHEFSNVDLTLNNLIMKIENNYKLEETDLTIQQALAKSKIITVGIGMDELASKAIKQTLFTKEKDEYLNDMEKLLKLIRNFNAGEIYLLGIYEAYNMKPEDVKYINDSLKEKADKYNIRFIDISNIIEKREYFSSNNSYYLNYKGHKEIANRILNL